MLIKTPGLNQWNKFEAIRNSQNIGIELSADQVSQFRKRHTSSIYYDWPFHVSIAQRIKQKEHKSKIRRPNRKEKNPLDVTDTNYSYILVATHSLQVEGESEAQLINWVELAIYGRAFDRSAAGKENSPLFSRLSCHPTRPEYKKATLIRNTTNSSLPFDICSYFSSLFVDIEEHTRGNDATKSLA